MLPSVARRSVGCGDLVTYPAPSSPSKRGLSDIGGQAWQPFRILPQADPVDLRTRRTPKRPTSDAGSGTALDPPRLLDVDVDQLAGTLALIALRWFQADPPEL